MSEAQALFNGLLVGLMGLATVLYFARLLAWLAREAWLCARYRDPGERAHVRNTHHVREFYGDHSHHR